MNLELFSIGNAAGFVKGPGREFADMLRSAATEITIGSITLEPRAGNEGTTYYYDTKDGTGINALGLPNPGASVLSHHAAGMAREAKKAGKKLIWSVAGFKPIEYGQLVKIFSPFGDIELNLGCPNVWGSGEQKPIASFNLKLMDAILEHASAAAGRATLRVKVSPYSDPTMIPAVAAMLKKYRNTVRAIVCCNTFPNAVAVSEKLLRTIDTPNGYGGMGGNALHYIALGQAAQFAQELKGSGINVIGVGGIDTGQQILAMDAVGASGVQIGTAFGQRGANMFSHLLIEITSRQ